MDFMVNIDLPKLPEAIRYGQSILLTGSCFTEHIGDSLADFKFPVLQNPHGILFDPLSVSESLISYAENKQYKESDLFLLNEVWYSWQHHSRFSHTDKLECLRMINESQQHAHEFLKKADWIIITLGTSFSYRLTPQPPLHKWRGGEPVANCHRAPAQWFTKNLLEADEITQSFVDCFRLLKQFNPAIKLIFTVSPVRHIRDGVVDNNRSKARLIESVHQLVNKYDHVSYFPAYELVIDVLRDYRFYDVDLVHPNYAATEFVLEKFAESCIDEASVQLMDDIRKIVIAARHKPFQPSTNAHQQFLILHFEKAKMMMDKYPFLDFKKEIAYFAQSSDKL